VSVNSGRHGFVKSVPGEAEREGAREGQGQEGEEREGKEEKEGEGEGEAAVAAPLCSHEADTRCLGYQKLQIFVTSIFYIFVTFNQNILGVGVQTFLPIFEEYGMRSTALLTGMTGISLHVQWPPTSQSRIAPLGKVCKQRLNEIPVANATGIDLRIAATLLA
jgi:hypothetical protein